MLSRFWYIMMDIAMRTSFQSGSSSLWSGSMKMTLTTTRIIRPKNVMRLGATHTGTNRNKYSAKGDHRYSYVILSVPPVYLNYFKVWCSRIWNAFTVGRDVDHSDLIF